MRGGGRGREGTQRKEGGTEREEVVTHWLTPQMPSTTGAGQAEDRSQEFNPDPPPGWQGPLGPSPIASQTVPLAARGV